MSKIKEKKKSYYYIKDSKTFAKIPFLWVVGGIVCLLLAWFYFITTPFWHKQATYKVDL